MHSAKKKNIIKTKRRNQKKQKQIELRKINCCQIKTAIKTLHPQHNNKYQLGWQRLHEATMWARTNYVLYDILELQRKKKQKKKPKTIRRAEADHKPWKDEKLRPAVLRHRLWLETERLRGARANHRRLCCRPHGGGHNTQHKGQCWSWRLNERVPQSNKRMRNRAYLCISIRMKT